MANACIGGKAHAGALAEVLFARPRIPQHKRQTAFVSCIKGFRGRNALTLWKDAQGVAGRISGTQKAVGTERLFARVSGCLVSDSAKDGQRGASGRKNAGKRGERIVAMACTREPRQQRRFINARDDDFPGTAFPSGRGFGNGIRRQQVRECSPRAGMSPPVSSSGHLPEQPSCHPSGIFFDADVTILRKFP